MEFNPRQVFLNLFYDGKGVVTEQSAKENASLLDLINEQTRALQRDLNPSDRAILDSHLTAVREAERRAEQRGTVARDLSGVQLPPIPAGVPDAFDEQVKLLFDLIAIAYRMDRTRVVAFMMAAERTNQTYNHIGVPDSFHPISHHANQLDKIERLVKIQTWHMERFAEFLGKLAAIQDGEGTLLDNAMFLYGSNMSNSDTPQHLPAPDPPDWRRRRQTDRRPSSRTAGPDANCKPASDPAGHAGHRAEDLRRQHRHDRPVKGASFQGVRDRHGLNFREVP